tara:strand:- start:385 stop:987 length:603 start_codon:yes stop_codon:yes gene_type:complete
MNSEITLKTYNVFKCQLPEEIFKLIKKECSAYKKLEELQSGISGTGVPKSYFLKESMPLLEPFIFKLAKEYDLKHNYLRANVKILTKDAPWFLDKPWVNIQKPSQFIPIHNHDGVFSYVIWVNIPYDVEKECAPPSKHASCFQFFYPAITGSFQSHTIRVSKTDEGTILLFPSLLLHCVYPFYTVKEPRLSVSGNILLKV